MDGFSHDPDFWDERCYYDPDASPTELDTYFERLIQYVGPTPQQAANPHHRSSRIQAKRHGRRDDELQAMRVHDITNLARHIFWDALVRTGRDRLTITRFPHLAQLRIHEDTP